MSDISREFIKKHKDVIICEPSGRSYAELERDRVRKIMILRDDFEQLKKKKKKGEKK